MSDIKIYNSLTNKIEEFIPLKENEVSMYVCGPTVYNYPHIGNMRPVVVFDTLRRLFTYLGYKVTYVSNFTDVDDKIINASIEKNISEKELTDFYISQFKKTVREIGSLDPTVTPRVTEYIDKIITYISKLVELNAAYVANDNVYFRVSKIKDYGSLSGINIEDLLSGARIEKNEEKESPLDFVLWKKTNVGINWPSPWGNGRPGWHTECCVMIDTIFHESMIDIHGGGYDLKFPHHENEIAQCEAMHHNKIARYWMHNAFININDEKMSKSKNNFIYAKDLINEYGGVVTRLVILNNHYRQPVNFKDDTILNAQNQVKKINQVLKMGGVYLAINNLNPDGVKPNDINPFLNALKDDLNTANAISELNNQIKKINMLLRNKEINKDEFLSSFKTLLDMLNILGIDLTYPKLSQEDIALYNNYLESKENKDFIKSDEYRKLLIEKGIL